MDNSAPKAATLQPRRQLLMGVATAMSERGYADLTVTHVIAAAGVSRSTFYRYFANKEEAVVAAHDLVREHFFTLLMRACGGEEEWSLKVKAAIGVAVDFAVSEPSQARLLTLDALAASVAVTQRVLEAGDRLASLLGSGREHSPHGPELPELMERALVGAVTAVVAGRLMRREPEMLIALQPQLVELVLMPYLGAEGAARVAGTA